MIRGVDFLGAGRGSEEARNAGVAFLICLDGECKIPCVRIALAVEGGLQILHCAIAGRGALGCMGCDRSGD